MVQQATNFVEPHNQDGRAFICHSARALASTPKRVDITARTRRTPGKPAPARVHLDRPTTFQHYVLNLPASALSFLDAFVGLYRGHESLFAPTTAIALPMIHVYAFAPKGDDDGPAHQEICGEITRRLGHEMRPESGAVEFWEVRDVAPKKRMFCASFRLPPEVAFREE